VNHGNTLYITGLSSRVTDKELREYFSKEGKVVSCHVVLEPHTRVSRGFAFLTMDTVEDAERCIKYLNGSEMQGRNITVEKSRRGRPRTPTPGSYLGHRYERREMQRGGGRFRRGGYGRDDYYGNSVPQVSASHVLVLQGHPRLPSLQGCPGLLPAPQGRQRLL